MKISGYSNGEGPLYAVSDSGNITTIGYYTGFDAVQQGPDGYTYFLDGWGHFYRQEPNSVGYPQDIGIISPYYGNFNPWLWLPQLVSFNDCIVSSQTPTFNTPRFICKGTTLDPFSTTSLEGITGSWSPAINNMSTTTYTFTADPGQCAVPIISVTVNVNDQNTVSLFNDYSYVPTSICVGSSYTFPTTSSNQITGTWSPAFNNTATTTYTFTPTSAQCGASTTNTIKVMQNVTPIFDYVAPICSGDSLELPTYSKNGIYGHWVPYENNIETTTYTYTPISGCAVPTTMTIVVNPKATPTFDAIPYVCSGMVFSPLQTSSNNSPPITGTWSPAFNNTTTTTYTFNPNAGQCVTGSPQTMTVAVNPTVTPVFSDLSVLNDDVISYTLPATSANWISGSWSPPTLAEGDNMYTFTPSGGTCVASVTKNYLWLKPKAISAADDNFYLRDTGNPWQLYQTPSVFDNDYTIFGGIPNSDDVDVQIVSAGPDDYYFYLDQVFVTPDAYPEINPDGTISFYGIDYFDPIYITYRIVQKSCPDNYATATATLLLTNMSSTARQVAEEPQQLTDKLVIYPNPSTGIFNLDLTAIDEEYETIEVFNMLGAKIYEERLLIKSNNTIDLSDMAIGFYIAKVSGKNSSQTFQLIKQ